jgi:hypothetical protein
MSVWIVIESATKTYNGEYTIGDIILEKAFRTKEAAEEWIDQQEYWWRYVAYELPVQE